MSTFNLKSYLSKQAQLNGLPPTASVATPAPSIGATPAVSPTEGAHATQPTPRPNPLDGKSNPTARSFVNRILSQYSKSPTGGSLFSDNSWEGIHRVWKALDDAGVDWVMTGNQYIKDPNDADPRAMPKSKEWRFEVKFTNNKGRPTVLYGVMTAHGAGSVEQPLDRYDITAYVN